MSKLNHNSKGMIFVEMSPELAEFVIDNCKANMTMALNMLDPTDKVATGLSQEALEKIVDMNEKFKMLKLATERAMR